MEISIIPLGSGHPGVGEYIADVEKYLRQQNIPHELTDMGTLVHGDVHRLLEVARALHELPFAKGVKRVVTHLTIDDRRDKEVRLGDKISAVKQRLA